MTDIINASTMPSAGPLSNKACAMETIGLAIAESEVCMRTLGSCVMLSGIKGAHLLPVPSRFEVIWSQINPGWSHNTGRQIVGGE